MGSTLFIPAFLLETFHSYTRPRPHPSPFQTRNMAAIAASTFAVAAPNRVTTRKQISSRKSAAFPGVYHVTPPEKKRFRRRVAISSHKKEAPCLPFGGRVI